MPRSWNHSIVRWEAPPNHESCGARLGKGEVVPPEERITTWRSSRECGRRPVYLGRYDYVTGSRGRVTDRRVPLCDLHGSAWAKKHGLELP